MKVSFVLIAFLGGALALGSTAGAEESADKSAKKATCSIQPPKGTDKAALSQMAKVTREDAEATVLAQFAPKKPGAIDTRYDRPNVVRGCLVWEFQVDFWPTPRRGASTQRFRVLVDAGDGKLLSSEDVSTNFMK